MPRWRRPVAGALLGASGASLVLGTVWSFLAKSEYDHALATECGGDPNSCSAQGIADGRNAHDRALVSTVAFVGAAAFLAGAATVYLLARDPRAGRRRADGEHRRRWRRVDLVAARAPPPRAGRRGSP